MGWTAGIQFPAGVRFSLLHSVQSGSGAHPASYPLGTGGSFPGGKTAGAWSWPPPPSAEVKNGWAIPPLPHMSSLHSDLSTGTTLPLPYILMNKANLHVRIVAFTKPWGTQILILWICGSIGQNVTDLNKLSRFQLTHHYQLPHLRHTSVPLNAVIPQDLQNKQNSIRFL
jgi:hypothetical protein